jgi:hypothetical protein
MEGNKPRFPPSLNSVKSDYRIFCAHYGGPIICDERFARINFEYCCREFPRQKFEPTIGHWVPDPVHGIRHWPVMAYAASQYAFRQREFSKYGAEPSYTQVRELLDEIRKNAQRLLRALVQLQEMSARLSDGTAPLNEPRLAMGHFARMDFLRRLTDLEVAAQRADKQVDRKLLRRTRASENRALRTLVAMAKPIWQSLTGRKASVNKVAGERRSDFATFVQQLAKIAGGPEPTFKQVQTAFRVRTPD